MQRLMFMGERFQGGFRVYLEKKIKGLFLPLTKKKEAWLLRFIYVLLFNKICQIESLREIMNANLKIVSKKKSIYYA